jgi:hypothetical protein
MGHRRGTPPSDRSRPAASPGYSTRGALRICGPPPATGSVEGVWPAVGTGIVDTYAYSTNNRYFHRGRPAGMHDGSLGSQRAGREDTHRVHWNHHLPGKRASFSLFGRCHAVRLRERQAEGVACVVRIALRFRSRELDYSNHVESSRSHQVLPEGSPRGGLTTWRLKTVEQERPTRVGQPRSANPGEGVRVG